MADPFSRCESVNRACFRCWLCSGHGYGIHEAHPSDWDKSRKAGASPVWTEDTARRPAPCRFCGAPVNKPAEGRWHSTDVRDDSPWTCPSNIAGHWPNWLPLSLLTTASEGPPELSTTMDK